MLSHSQICWGRLWQGPADGERILFGHKLEALGLEEQEFDFICSEDLLICNKGNYPSFEIAGRDEDLDLSLAIRELAPLISDRNFINMSWDIQYGRFEQFFRSRQVMTHCSPPARPSATRRVCRGIQCGMRELSWKLMSFKNSERQKETPLNYLILSKFI